MARQESVLWIVNGLAELGVRIAGTNYHLYKGGSIVYEQGVYANLILTGKLDEINFHHGTISNFWRPVEKREFGECCHPLGYSDEGIPDLVDQWPNFDEDFTEDINMIESAKKALRNGNLELIANLLPGSGWWFESKPVQPINWTLELRTYMQQPENEEFFKFLTEKGETA